jgi:hypothetical protein
MGASDTSPEMVKSGVSALSCNGGGARGLDLRDWHGIPICAG